MPSQNHPPSSPPPNPPNGSGLSVSTKWITAAAIAAGLGFVGGGFALGIWAGLSTHSTAATATATTSAATPSRPSASGTTSGDPFAVGQAAPFSATVLTLHNHPTHLARGSRGTVIMAMASWCLYCGYEDKWVLPMLAKTPGVAVDIIDVSPQGGIADPGPQSPPFSGHDGVGGPLSVPQMETTMQQYVKTFGTLSAPNIHVYVATAAVQSAWHVNSFPTLGFVNAQGRFTNAPPGALTLSQAQQTLKQALSS